jgi:hypothetical protein
VAPEVSALDYTNGLTISGYTIPALSTRRVHTEIELQPGQSFAIGGLIDRRLTETIMRIPGLADLPLIGNLFKSRNLQRTNSELLILATPEIVKPMPEGQPTPSLTYPKDLPDPIGAPLPHGGRPNGGTERRPSVPYEEMKGPQNQNGTPALVGPNNSGLPYTANPFQQFLPVPNTGTPPLQAPPEGAAGTAQQPSQLPPGRP